MNTQAMRPLPLSAALLLCTCTTQQPIEKESPDLYTVTRGNLRVTVREQGEIQAARNTRIASQMEGTARLIYLIPEGTVVQAGDRLAVLDASAAEEKLAAQGIAVARAEAALEQSKKSSQIMENALLASQEAARSKVTMAGLRRERFTGRAMPAARPAGHESAGSNAEMVDTLRELLESEFQVNPAAEAKNSHLINDVMEVLESEENLGLEQGEMARQIVRRVAQISLGRRKLGLARDRLERSEALYESDSIDKTERDANRLAYESDLADLTLAWNDLELLIKFTLMEEKISLRQDVRNAELNLDSVMASNEAARVREQAELMNKQVEFDLAKEREAHYRDQIANAVIYAPTPGLVVHANEAGATGTGRQPLREGMEIHQRRVLINLPDVTHMVADLKVHEAQVDQVSAGQTAVIRVESFPERRFTGTVARVSSLPDSGSRFTNAALKVYKTTVRFDGENRDGSLRPGMNATIEIELEVLEDVITVPLPALQRQGDQHYVWRETDSEPEAVPVQIGRNNLNHVEIVEGLRAGDQVFLATPHGVRPPDLSGREP